jgi:hypothetical protein
LYFCSALRLPFCHGDACLEKKSIDFVSANVYCQ